MLFTQLTQTEIKTIIFAFPLWCLIHYKPPIDTYSTRTLKDIETHRMLVQSLSSFQGQQDDKYHTEQLAIDHQFYISLK